MAVPTKIKQKIGKLFPSEVFEIEKGQIRRFAKAVGERNPIHFDEALSKKAGFSGLVAPLTFPTVLIELNETMQDLNLDPQGLMHAEEEYEYFRPIVAGDELTVQHEIVDAYEKNQPNGKLLFVIFVIRATDKKKKEVFKARRVVIELKT